LSKNYDYAYITSLVFGLTTLILFTQVWIDVKQSLINELGLLSPFTGISPGVGSLFSVILLVISIILLIPGEKFRSFRIPSFLIAFLSYANFIGTLMSQSLAKVLLAEEYIARYIIITPFSTITIISFTAYLASLAYYIRSEIMDLVSRINVRNL